MRRTPWRIASPFQFYLLNAPHEVTARTMGAATMLTEDLLLDIKWGEAMDAIFEYTRFGEVTPVDGVVHVIPELTTLPLLALGMLMARRR